jgi:hypothetical protein
MVLLMHAGDNFAGWRMFGGLVFSVRGLLPENLNRFTVVLPPVKTEAAQNRVTHPSRPKICIRW